MGKTKKIILGDEQLEKEQKEKAKKKAAAKKIKKEKVVVSAATVDTKSTDKSKNQVLKKETKSAKNLQNAHGKKYLSFKKQLANKKEFSLSEAINLLKTNLTTSFVASFELTLNVINTEVKGTLTLPHGTGKEVKVVIFDKQVEEKIKNNQIDFDILLATQSDMKDLVKYAKVLGPRGLMPSPKKGTLTAEPEKAKEKFLAGELHFKTEPKAPIIHQVIGKTSFSVAELEENIRVFLKAVAKRNIVSAFLKTTMSPSLKLDLKDWQ